MSLFTLIKISSYTYILTSLLLPETMIDLTAQFMSYIIVVPLPMDDVIPHVCKSILLLVGFVVLYTILGGNAVYALVKNEEKNRANIIPQKQLIQQLDQPNTTTAVIEKEKMMTVPTNNASMHAVLENTTQQSTKITTTTVITVDEPNVSIISKVPVAEPEKTVVPVTEELQQDMDTLVAPSPPITDIVENDQSTTTNIQLENNGNIVATSQVSNNNNDDDILTATTVVEQILVHDQLTKDIPISTSTTIDEHVTSTNNTNDTTTTTTVGKMVEQPDEEIIVTTTEAALVKSEEQQQQEEEEEEHRSITTTSTTITPPAEADESKEHYYSELNRKDSNLISLSDNLERIFDEPPQTPLPQLDTSMIESLLKNEDSAIVGISKRRQSSVEETTTPIPAPQEANSSRRSSTSTKSTSVKSVGLKNILAKTIPKVSSAVAAEEPVSVNNSRFSGVVEPQQISSASSITKGKSKFPSLRLARKKSKTAENISLPPQQMEQPQLPTLPVEVKSSVSSKLHNKLKKSGKRLSKIFS